MRNIIEIAYFTHQFQVMEDFYRKLLDTEPIEKSEGMAIFLTGTVKLLLHAAYTPAAGELSPADHMAVAARDVDAVCKALAEQGIQVDTPPKDYDWGRSAYLRDPDGHILELNQASTDWRNGHNFFSASCFNRAWDFMDMVERTPEEDELMIASSLASIYHWSQRPDCTDTNRSIGFWQASRVFALVGQVENARHYAQLSLKYSQEDTPFYRGYAFEALARAEMIGGNTSAMQEHLAKARMYTALVPDLEDRKVLEADLDLIK